MSEINWKVGYEVKCQELTKKEKELHDLELDYQSLQAEVKNQKKVTVSWMKAYTKQAQKKTALQTKVERLKELLNEKSLTDNIDLITEVKRLREWKEQVLKGYEKGLTELESILDNETT